LILGRMIHIHMIAVIKGSAIIGANSVIEAQTYMEDMIISSNTYIRRNCQVVNKVIFEDWLISKDGPVQKLSESMLAKHIGDVREQPDCIFPDELKHEEVIDGERGLLSA